MNVLFVGDLHLGHRTVLEHSKKVGKPRKGNNIDEHDRYVINQCLSVGATKRTLWYIIGDVSFEINKLELINELPGRKILIIGNHDNFQTQIYLKYFEKVCSVVKKYGMWITHIPIHPLELRGKVNVHGHCHRNTLTGDYRYFNCAFEWLPNQKPVSLEFLREYFRGSNNPIFP